METCVERASRVAKSILRPALRDDQWRRMLWGQWNRAKSGKPQQAEFKLVIRLTSEFYAASGSSGQKADCMLELNIEGYELLLDNEFNGEQQPVDESTTAAAG